MTTRIGIIGDVHASPEPLQQALEIFENNAVTEIICCGDIAGYFDQLKPSIELLKKYQCKTIIGNHDQSWLEDNPNQIDTDEYRYLNQLPETLALEVEGKSIQVVHAEPPSEQHGGIKLLDKQGELIAKNKASWAEKLKNQSCDVLIVGHTHQVFALQLGALFVINPGSSAFNHSCVMLNLPEMQIETFALGNKAIQRSWNFGQLFSVGGDYPVRRGR